jgi:chromatin segregation and condensation protein Rec8/ScpA/Scc1 (kleisin family)
MSGAIRTTELARLLGISRQRVNELARMGKISRRPDGLWDAGRVRSELGRTLDNQQQKRARVQPDPPARDGGAEDMPSARNAHEMFNRARAVKEIALAKEKELELRRRQGELLEAADVETAWAKALASFKSRLLLLADKLAPKMAACPDVLQCRALIDREVRDALSALSEHSDEE